MKLIQAEFQLEKFFWKALVVLFYWVIDGVLFEFIGQLSIVIPNIFVAYMALVVVFNSQILQYSTFPLFFSTKFLKFALMARDILK